MSSALPRLDMTLMGDWGVANFHAIAGWIAANLRWRSAPGSTYTIRTGTGFRDNIDAVASGQVDLAITTPGDITLEWATAGVHFFAGTPYPHLRTLGALPHDDRLVLAVREDTGLRSFADLRERRPPLRVATTFRDRDNLMSYVVELVLRAHDIDPAQIEQWGGAWLEHDYPRRCLRWAIDGEANAVFNEGVMIPQWHELVETVPMRFIDMEESALASLALQYGLRPAVLAQGRLRAAHDVPCVDFSNWVVVVREDMPESLTYAITAIMVDERGELEARYRHLPPDRSPLTVPVDPSRMCQGLGAPLHPGAARYYREHGYLD